MKKLITKYILISLALILTLSACVKDMEINIHDTSRAVVVTCLFNPQENWELTISETKTLHEDEDIYIDGALVEITSETGEQFTLNYTGEKGIYKNNNYPEMGKTYTLTISIPGHDEITAQSTVPVFVNATVPGFEIKWVKYLYPNNLMDYDVFPLKVNFDENINDARFMFRALTFNPQEGYKRYMLTVESLTKLQKIGLPEDAYNELYKLVDKWRVSMGDFTKVIIYNVDDIQLRSILYTQVQQELKQKTASTREKEAFNHAVCFQDDAWLYNISYDMFTVIGESKDINQAALLYASANLKYHMDRDRPWGWEFWLEVTRGSNEYIEYYRTYILQVSQRINPYSEPVMVHSNITNATGIFAGYNRQMIHLFTY